jgi:hypothetical protein
MLIIDRSALHRVSLHSFISVYRPSDKTVYANSNFIHLEKPISVIVGCLT